MANEFIRRVSPEVPASLTIATDEVAGDQRFSEPDRFFFTSLLSLTDAGFWMSLLDWVRPHRSRIASSLRRGWGYLERLMSSNTTRVANDLSSRVAESQRRLEYEIRQRLSALLASAERALERARAQHAAGAEAVKAELRRLAALRERVEQVASGATDARADQVIERRT